MGDVNEDLQQKLQINISVINNCVPIGSHCLICNSKLYPEKIEGQKEVVYLFQAQTTATQHDVYILLGNLVGKEISAKQIHSDIICRRCFRLLDRIDFLQEELSNAKEKIIRQFQQTDLVHVSKAKIDIEDSPSDRGLMGTENVNSIEQSEGLSERLCVPPNHNAVIRLPQEDSSQENTNLPLFPSKDYLRTVIEHPSKRIPLIGFDKDPGDTEEEHPDKTELGIKNCSFEERTPNRPKKFRKNGKRFSSNHLIKLSSFSCIKCLHCEMAFPVSTGLRTHLVQVHSVAEWEVDEGVLKSWIHQKMLVSKEHTNPLALVCCWCQKSYDRFDEYYHHLHDEHFLRSYERYCKIVEDFKGSISCRLCGITLTKVIDLDEHSKAVHSKEAIRVCLLCDEPCNGKAALFRHINHHILGVQQCTICPCKYSTQRQFTSHLQSFHENKYSVKCTQCLRSFRSYASYEIHHDTEHGDVEKPASNSLTVNMHHFEVKTVTSALQTEGEGKPANMLGRFCNTCNVAFSYKTQYQRHLYKSHPSNFRFRCEECECLFKQFGDLISHQISHIFGSHRCPHCSVKFSRVDQIKKHLPFSHPFIKGLECKLCIKILKTYDTYLNHLKLKHPEASGSAITYVNCNVCQKKFANKYQLFLHKRVHDKVSDTCSICRVNVKHLSSHMNCHTKAVSYPCKECGVSYINKSSLNVHFKRTHMGEAAKKHPCTKCSKRFLSSSDLEVHTSRVHHGERKFVCRYCDKAYKNKVTLTYHMRKHTGQKPHECTLCNMAFEIPTMLRQHLKRDHNATYKGVYFKKTSSSDPVKGKEKASQLNVVHINVPADMRKEIVSTSYQEESTDDKILIVIDC